MGRYSIGNTVQNTAQKLNGRSFSMIIAKKQDLPQKENTMRKKHFFLIILALGIAFGKVDFIRAQGSTCFGLTVSGDTSFPRNGGSQVIFINKPSNCSGTLSIVTAQSWVTTSKASSTSFRITVGRTTISRTASFQIRVNGGTVSGFRITQEGPTPPPTPSTPTISSNNCGTVTLRASSPNGISWYWQGTNSNGTSINNRDSDYLVTSPGRYYLRARNDDTGVWSSSSSSRTVSSISSFKPGSISGAQTICAGGNPSTIGSTASASGGTTYSYQWQMATSQNGSYSNITGATGLTYNPPVLPATRWYRRRVISCGSQQLFSNKIAITVNPRPGTASGSNKSRCGNGRLTLTASPGSNGNTIRWYSAASGGTLLHTGNSYTTPTLSGTTTYYAQSYNSSTGCGASTRRAITATISPTVGTASVNGSARCGNGTLTLSASPGTNGNTVRWYNSATGGTLLATGADYTTPSISTTTTYYAESYNTNTQCNASSRTAVVAEIDTPEDWYLDADGDGYAISTISNCGSPGAGYVNTVLPLNDCNDDPGADGALYNPDTVWYQDDNNDGFADAGAETLQQCDEPSGNWTLTSELAPCGVSETEKQALLDLYAATDGDNWTNTLAGDQPWDTNIPVCEWFGVTVSNNRIFRIDLDANNLTGNIPSSIGILTFLQALHLHANNLSGGIPAEIGTLENLAQLWLYTNRLTGSIPQELGQLSNLTSLNLENNELSGTIPPELGNLANLGTLFLYNNQLSGNIPIELGLLSNLTRLYVQNNQLEGNIPSEIGNILGISQLLLSNNNLSGPVPTSISLLAELDRFHMGDNRFVYSDFESGYPIYETNLGEFIYSPQAKVDSEETLSVPENESITLTGTTLSSPNNSYQWFKDGVAIPGATAKDFEIENATPDDAGTYYFEATNSVITGLTLTRNNITLTIDPPIDTCGVSETEKQALLNLYDATDGDNWTNTLADDRPWDSNTPVCDWFGVTVENGTVIALQLQANGVNGTLPETMGNLPNMKLLNLSDNSLLGQIPASLGSILELENLLLPNNNLTGVLPTSLGSLSDLVVMDLSNNNLQSQIPISFCNLTNLTDLNLSFNGLFGEVPREIELMGSLVRLNLSHNTLSGQLPSTIVGLRNLQEVIINDNQLKGPLFLTATLNGTLERFNFENNHYVFSDFQTKHNGYSQFLDLGYTYTPQAKTDEIVSKSVTLGNSITLTTELSSAPENSFTWFKDDVPIDGAITHELLIENATEDDAGTYHFTVTNTDIPGLELERHPITLNVIASCDVSPAERQALIALYTATNGPNWSNTVQSLQPWAINDANSLVCDWFGVTVTDNTVTEIILPNNGLQGALPNVFSAFPSLETVILSGNALNGDISNIFTANSGLQSLALENNDYLFEDMEADFAALTSQLDTGFSFQPQAKIDSSETLNSEPGSSITLTSDVPTSINNNYQWYKDGLIIPEATSKELVLSDLTADDEAVYHFSVTNSIVTGLTLEREMITVQLNNADDACGVSDLERQALIDLFEAMGGTNWTTNTGWNTDAPVCDWFGITTDDEAHVIGIDLPDNGLRGEIPETIAQLIHLINLNLSSNNVIGEIPVAIGNLSALQSLVLNNNILVGQIPESLGSASTLVTLNLGFNRFSGPIPSSIGNLQQLQTLELNDNKLRESIPPGLWTIITLTRIQVSNNELTGSISPNLGNLTVLEEFWLSNNNFSGTVPTTITNLPVLRSVRLNDNAFRGDIPVLIPDLTFPGAEITLENNGFVFSDFEDEYPAYSTLGDNFTYDPQADVDRRETISVLENDSLTLGTEALSSPNNSYIWYKDGEVIPDVTGNSYTIPDFNPLRDSGDYWFVASNSVIPVLELTRRRITLVELIIPPLQPLVLTALCSEEPSVSREWRIQNSNAENVSVNWQVLGTSQSGTVVALPGITMFSTNTEVGDNTVQIIWLDSDGLEQSAEVTSNGDLCDPQTVCTNTLDGLADGSFETATDADPQSRNGNLDAFGWTVEEGTLDTFSPPFTNNGDPYLKTNFNNSPDGGTCVGALRAGSTTESFSTSVTGLTQGATYIVEFYQANATRLLDTRMVDEAYGYWELAIGSEVKNSNRMVSKISATRWQRERLEFVAANGQEILQFRAASTATDASNSYPVYVLIDGIRVYRKPIDPYTTTCYDIATQVFCNTDDLNSPTIADLVAPQAVNVTWHSDPVGGTRYFKADELIQLPSLLWADDGSGTRTALEVIFDLGAPEGPEYQSFDLGENPTLANVVVEGTNITWHDSFSNATELPLSTVLVDEGVYYAAQDGNTCRLAVSINLGIPELNGNGYQEFCSSNAPKVGDLIMQPTNPGYTIAWYSASTGGTEYGLDDPLVDDTLYYAVQTNGTLTGEDRFPVRVSVIDVEGQARNYEQDVLFPINSTVADITSFYRLDSDTQWYNEAFGGTAYFDTNNLEDGNTYYARIGEGLCAGLKVLAITVNLEEDTAPELVSCIKFIPQPGQQYVISGWVREEALTPQSAGTIDFNQDEAAKEAVLGLFNALTKTIVQDKLEVPQKFVVKSLFPDLDMSAVLPYLKDFSGNKVAVHDFKFEIENVDGLEQNIGYSFSLDPGSDNRLEYRTPEVVLAFPEFVGITLEFGLGRHFPLRNYDNLEITHNSVSIISGDRLRVNSDFILTPTEGSHLKSEYNGYDTDGPSSSGIEGTMEIFDYLENPDLEAINYEDTFIELEFEDTAGAPIPVSENARVFSPKGAVIDGWQRISSVFPIPANAAYMRINLKTNLDGVNAYFDDVRMLPVNGNMKSFVYDPMTQRLQAELDENNYATFYEYDTEGGLVRVKKETERGIYTIQETRSGNTKLSSSQ